MQAADLSGLWLAHRRQAQQTTGSSSPAASVLETLVACAPTSASLPRSMLPFAALADAERTLLACAAASSGAAMQQALAGAHSQLRLDVGAAADILVQKLADKARLCAPRADMLQPVS